MRLPTLRRVLSSDYEYFMAHFRLNDEGEFELEGLGEAAEGAVVRRSYPILDKAILEKENIRDAVDQERARLWPKDD
jgi:hypothetical protein